MGKSFNLTGALGVIKQLASCSVEGAESRLFKEENERKGGINRRKWIVIKVNTWPPNFP